MSLSYSNALIVANGKKPHTALVLSDNEVIDTVAAYMKKGRAGRPFINFFKSIFNFKSMLFHVNVLVCLYCIQGTFSIGIVFRFVSQLIVICRSASKQKSSKNKW
ncbi:hypothetical protein N0392_20080 [Morganella morganii]|uniref:Uncharacterized protein n=1 Tax=Morganella morganii TaxID=582 RepID=A0A9Q4CVA5_MORMO|nr:hypothetical protein [Morganella morganii]MCY0791963.1 hypothetical protein [Morganella morganii]